MKICVATGTRAEYGLLKPLIDDINAIEDWHLQLLVTGAHLSPEFGLTFRAIEQDGFKIDQKVEMLLSSDTAEGITKSMGLGIIGFADALKNLQPDLLVILGDRYEMLALASAALIFKIPVAHIHGGEITEGAYDDAIRHAITKMSHIHFASTDAYRNRIMQMGEQPHRVFNVGAIGLDNIYKLSLLDKDELENVLNLQFKKRNYLVTFHPATLEDYSPEFQFSELLHAIDMEPDSFFIFTKANSDTDGRIINKMIDAYVSAHPDTTASFVSMGQLRYLSTMKIVDAVVGNSSSGIIEAPSFHVPTINIGDRQKGRIQATSVINVSADRKDISTAFATANSLAFKTTCSVSPNPYGSGNTSSKIVQILKSLDFSRLIHKEFHNIL
jgi:GDP/UDP-N,N'-diacetylbacillosamine 2-epimerase (hydrolysing)